MQSQETKKWPVALAAGFLLIIIASFMTWGNIRYHYTWQFMANLEHPGLCNRILTGDDLSANHQSIIGVGIIKKSLDCSKVCECD